MKRNLSWVLAAILSCGLVAAQAARAAEKTSLELVKEGNRYLGEQCKDKVVYIHSEKSVASLTPNIWYIGYYDPTATMKISEVKFGSGQMLKVTRPGHFLDPRHGFDEALDRDKIKVDSDAAIKKAVEDPSVKNIKITATQPRLERAGSDALGKVGVNDPVWKVKLWANKLRNPSKDANIGEIWLSATDGKVIKPDLHLDRID